MAKIPGFCGEMGSLPTFNFGGTANNNAPTLILPRGLSRSYLRIQNTSDTIMRVGIGPATAVATITSNILASIAVTNGGFGYTKPPIVKLLGGGPWNPMIAGALAAGLGSAAPADPGAAHAVLTADAVSSVVVDKPGAGYTDAHPPYVYFESDPTDPYGCYAPSATQGLILRKSGDVGDVIVIESSIVTTDPVAIFCGSASKTFECTVML